MNLGNSIHYMILKIFLDIRKLTKQKGNVMKDCGNYQYLYMCVCSLIHLAYIDIYDICVIYVQLETIYVFILNINSLET